MAAEPDGGLTNHFHLMESSSKIEIRNTQLTRSTELLGHTIVYLMHLRWPLIGLVPHTDLNPLVTAMVGRLTRSGNPMFNLWI